MSNSHSKSWFYIPLKASYNNSIVSFHIKWKTTDKRQWMLKVISEGIKPAITLKENSLYDKNTYVCILYSSLHNYERYYSRPSFQLSDNRFGAINLVCDLLCILIKTLSITFHMDCDKCNVTSKAFFVTRLYHICGLPQGSIKDQGIRLILSV